MKKEEILKRFNKQKLELASIEESSPYFISGEWEWIVNSKLPEMEEILSFSGEQFYNIEHISMENEIKRHLGIAKQVQKLSTTGDVYLEIGAGTGGVCYHLMDKFYKNNKYVIFDIPETLLVCYAFLRENMNKKFKVYYYGDETESFDLNKILRNYDIVLLPHYKFEDVSIEFDVFINTGSFCEMPVHTCENYIDKVLSFSKGGNKYFMEYRRADMLCVPEHGPREDHKNEICVHSIMEKKKISIKSMQQAQHNHTYWEVTYED